MIHAARFIIIGYSSLNLFHTGKVRVLDPLFSDNRPTLVFDANFTASKRFRFSHSRQWSTAYTSCGQPAMVSAYVVSAILPHHPTAVVVALGICCPSTLSCGSGSHSWCTGHFEKYSIPCSLEACRPPLRESRVEAEGPRPISSKTSQCMDGACHKSRDFLCKN